MLCRRRLSKFLQNISCHCQIISSDSQSTYYSALLKPFSAQLRNIIHIKVFIRNSAIKAQCWYSWPEIIYRYVFVINRFRIFSSNNHKTIVPKLIWLCTYDLHVRGFVASNEVVLVESIATPTLLLSFPDGFPGFKMKIYYYELLYLN